MIRRAVKHIENEGGMEMVQVAILIGIAVGMGILFKGQIGSFINGIFGDLVGTDFTSM